MKFPKYAKWFLLLALLQPSFTSTVKADLQSLPNDPFFNPPNQSWLHPDYDGIGIDVWQVWCGEALPFFQLQQRYFGRNAHISILDDGVQGNHPDLAHAYDATMDADFVDGDNDGSPSTIDDNHGTQLAGIIVGKHNNGIGVAGVAPAATFSSTRIYSSSDADIMASALEHEANETDIVLLGFSTEEDYADLPVSIEDAFLTLAEENNTPVTYPALPAAGGNRLNYNRAASHRHTIACATTQHAAPGSNLIVAVPGTQLVSTDRTGADGDNLGDYLSRVGGTPTAAATVAGVIALMHEARPDLGWRDYQDILLLSASAVPESQLNGASFSTPFGVSPYKFSYNAGGGLVNGLQAVALAERWPLLPNGDAYKKVQVSQAISEDIGAETSHFTFNFAQLPPSQQNIKIEHIEIVLEWEEVPFEDTRTPVEVELFSPYYIDELSRQQSMSSLVATKASGIESPNEWTYTTSRHWGLISDRGFRRTGWPGDLTRIMEEGEWELDVSIQPSSDPEMPQVRHLLSADLIIYGSEYNQTSTAISANVTSSGNPERPNYRTAFADEDLIVSDLVMYDWEGDELDVLYTWQSLDDGSLSWVDIDEELVSNGCVYKEQVSLTATADEGGNLEGTYFMLFEPDGSSVAFWFRFDENTMIPPEASAADRSVAITGVAADDRASWVTSDIRRAINLDGLFSADFGSSGELLISYPEGVLDVPSPDVGSTPFAIADGVIDDPSGNCFGSDPIRLDSSLTVSGRQYRVIVTPRDATRDGFRFISAPIFVNSRPITITRHGEFYEYDVDLAIATTPPEILTPTESAVPKFRFYPGDGSQPVLDVYTGHPIPTAPDFVQSDFVPGLSIDENTGILRGVPQVPTGGIFTVKIQRFHPFASEIQIYNLMIEESPPLDDDQDEDGDGLNNLLETALGSDAFKAEAEVMQTGQLVSVGGSLHPSISFRRLKGGVADFFSSYYYIIDDLVYTVETSSDLKTWTLTPENFLVEEIVLDYPELPSVEIVTLRTIESTDTLLDDANFYMRLSVTRLQ